MRSTKAYKTRSNAVEFISMGEANFGGTEREIQDFASRFQKLYSAGKILNESLTDLQWTVVDHQNRRRNIIFDAEIYHSLMVALKCFTVTLVEQGFSSAHVQAVIHRSKEVIQVTKGLNVSYLPDLEDYIATFNYRARAIFATYPAEFLTFIINQNSSDFIDVCAQFSNNITKRRELPDYVHFLFFSEKIEEFIKVATDIEKRKFFPIILWWKITTIIPLRPIDFLKIKRDCIFKRKNNQSQDEYFITVPREKQPATCNRDISVTDTLQINRDTYELISMYRDHLRVKDDSDYLITYTHYRTYTVSSGEKYGKDTDFLSSRTFYTLVEQFYRDVLRKQYGYIGIEAISPGDTRHFAFCNMMLQGFNMLTIARIGGHQRLDKQMHYWGHLEYFTQSWVYNLVEKRRAFKILNNDLPGANFTKENRQSLSIYKLDAGTDYSSYLPVDYGFCIDPNYPNNCSGECRHCDFYRFQPKEHEIDTAVNWLLDSSKMLERKINEQISLLQYVNRNIIYDLPNLSYSAPDQENLSSIANELNRMLHQKAIIDSHLPKQVKV